MKLSNDETAQAYHDSQKNGKSAGLSVTINKLMPFAGFLWFAATLVPLIVLQRALHREIQAVFLILTRNRPLSLGLFSLLFLPGVALHELSHLLMARLLRVPTGRVSLIPAPTPDGRLQLGYVETARTDVLRDSLIGLAPLFSGSAFLAYAGIAHMKLNVLWDVFAAGNLDLFFEGLFALPRVPDFYLWFYLAFAVSSTMTPSESDRHAWLPLGLWAAALLTLAVLAGAGGWLLANLAPLVDGFLQAAAILFGLSAALHLVLFLPFKLIRFALVKVTGVDAR